MGRTKVIIATRFQEDKQEHLLQGSLYDSSSEWTPVTHQPVADGKERIVFCMCRRNRWHVLRYERARDVLQLCSTLLLNLQHRATAKVRPFLSTVTLEDTGT